MTLCRSAEFHFEMKYFSPKAKKIKDFWENPVYLTCPPSVSTSEMIKAGHKISEPPNLHWFSCWKYLLFTKDWIYFIILCAVGPQIFLIESMSVQRPWNCCCLLTLYVSSLLVSTFSSCLWHLSENWEIHLGPEQDFDIWVCIV